jgi:glycosyltransferase involved in cell wall biosynthesis
MRIFYAVTDVPSTGHRAPGAVSIVTYQAAAALRDHGHDVVVQPFITDMPLSEQQQRDLQGLRGAGFDVEEPLGVHGIAPRRLGSVRDAVWGSAQQFFPGVGLADEVRRRANGADLVLHVWSPEALGACSQADAPVFAYYGNPDDKPIAARLEHPELFDIPRDRLRLALARGANVRRGRFGVELMKRCRFAGNVDEVGARYYAAAGHPNAFYIQNMWSDHGASARPGEENRIVGSIGSLGATGNTFGLVFLGREIVPALEGRFGDRFTVEICGGGKPSSAVSEALAHPRIEVRGWVDDIDATIATAKVFLIANSNHPDFVVGHTRLLHAWSLGACVVAHTGLALAVPELVHDENALVGSTGEEIAEHIAAALEDPELRERIAAGGRAAFERDFTPTVVAGRILERARAM